MTELIKITESKDGKKAVNARDLYNFLQIKTPFHKWIVRMLEYGFIENIDWTKMSSENQDFNIEYALSLNCAKEISMIQRTERGKEARLYFIRCEEIALQKQNVELPSYPQALRQLAEQIEQNEKLLIQNQAMLPKAEFFDAVTESKDTFDMAGVAKVLNLGFGRTILFAKLRELKVLRENNEPYQTYVDNGWFRCVESTFTKPNGDICINKKTVVFQKGVDGIRKMLNKKVDEKM